MFRKEPGEVPVKPFMLACIDTASRAIMGSDLLRDPPSPPQDLLSLLVVSMENPLWELALLFSLSQSAWTTPPSLS
jgi:hypothetical protein